MANKNIWKEIIEKCVRFVGEKPLVIGRDEKDTLIALVNTIDSGLLEDSVDFEVSSHAKENLENCFEYIDKHLKDIIFFVYYHEDTKEMKHKRFVMSAATQILNYLPDVKKIIETKAMSIPFIPSYAPYVALGVYARDRGRSNKMLLLNHKEDSIVNLIDENYVPNFNWDRMCFSC